MSRLIIYTGDVQELTGLGITAAKARLSSCRKHYGIPRRGPVTIAEFCELNRLDLTLVLNQINNHGKKRL